MSALTRRGRKPHPDVLTPAEWRIVHAVRHGMSNGAIAARLGVSRYAVKFHVANAVGKLALADRRALQRWHGAPIESALHHQEAPMADIALGAIGQVSREVGNIARAEAWYRDTLGLPHLYTYGNLAFFDCDGTRLFLVEHDGADTAANSILYFRVSDIEAAHRELSARGVAFEGAPHMIHKHPDGTEEWMAFFKDPDGGMLALMSQVKR